MPEVIVYAQVDDGSINDVSLQAIATARALADGTGATIGAVIAGSGVAALAATLFGYGADAVYVADDPRLDPYVAPLHQKVLADFLGARDVSAVLFPAGTVGDDLAPCLAAELNAACVLGCDNVTTDGNGLAMRRKEFDHKVTTSFRSRGNALVIATVTDGIAATPAADPSRHGDPAPLDVALDEVDGAVRILKRDVVSKTVHLKDARVIVAAGAGVGTRENFGLIEDLASKLGAQIGATRAVVDAGWLPADHQIGQTGSTVQPDLYVACGISGAIQHWVGMMDSKQIVCINTDGNAPMMKRAHYRIEGDVTAVVPKLTRLLEE